MESFAQDIHRAVTDLFPAFVHAVVASTDEELEPLHREEAVLVARAVPKRRREFLAGRACAHEALAALGLDHGPILAGRRREPQWPPGAVGSIAHAAGWSVAVVARDTDARAIGVDLEVLEPPLDDSVDRLVRTVAERDQPLPADHPWARHVGKLVFTVKETVYKCLYPLTGAVLEFSDVDVVLDVDEWAYTAAVAERTLRGGFRLVGGCVVTGLSIPS